MAVLPTVATNRPHDGETVAAAINHILADVLDHPKKAEHEVCIATAYFNPGGFLALAENSSGRSRFGCCSARSPQPATGRADGSCARASIWDPTGGALTRALDEPRAHA